MGEDLLDIRVDAQAIGRQRSGEPASANHIRIAADGACDVTGALAIDRVGVPYAANVDAVAYPGQKFGLIHSVTSPQHDTRSMCARVASEAASGSLAEAVGAAGREIELQPGSS